MTNFQVYKKTLPISIVSFLVDLFSLAIIIGFATGGFFIANSSSDKALIGLVVGLFIGVIVVIFISIFISNRIKAAQIAMMTRGVVEGELPNHVFVNGMKEVSGRFGTITLFFFITNAIKSIFNQLLRAINAIGTAVGGDTGNAVTSAINTVVQIIINYLSDCCLGWVLYRKEENAAKAACEGAAIFFRSGKTFFKNAGRIFGIGLLSLAVIAGGLFGAFYLIFIQFPQMFEIFASEIAEAAARGSAEISPIIMDPTNLLLITAALGAFILWAFIHNVFIHPFILVGVLRNFMAEGRKNIPSEADIASLESKSPKLAKLRNKYKNI